MRRDDRLKPVTGPGERFLALADELAPAAAAHAAEHDHKGAFPVEVFRTLIESGFMSATLAEDHGGLGLASTHDVAAGIARLGYADGSVALSANMHVVFPLMMRWVERYARSAGDTAMADGVALVLRVLAGGRVAMANSTEHGTDIAHPLLEATLVPGGWRLNGRKAFGTLSPIADVFLVTARYKLDEGGWGSGTAMVFRGAPGQQILDNWDALGMRSTGSNDVVYTDCFVTDNLFFPTGRWGEDTVVELGALVGANICLQAPFLGIAERARDIAAETARTRKRASEERPIAERPGVQRLVAEMDVDLTVMRATLERTSLQFDRLVLDGPVEDVSIELLHELHHDLQCTKLVVNRAAIDVVDRALTVAGGSSYLSGSPLARLYRDVRAGPFMQPYSPAEAYEYIGRVALGLDPTVTG